MIGLVLGTAALILFKLKKEEDTPNLLMAPLRGSKGSFSKKPMLLLVDKKAEAQQKRKKILSKYPNHKKYKGKTVKFLSKTRIDPSSAKKKVFDLLGITEVSPRTRKVDIVIYKGKKPKSGKQQVHINEFQKDLQPFIDIVLNRPKKEQKKGLSRKQRITHLVRELKKYNKAYRQGESLIPDWEYDAKIEQLRGLDPKNPWLLEVEPQPIVTKRKIFHNPPMLSIKKSYTHKKLRDYLNLMAKTAKKAGLTYATLRITPKLDGMAVDWSDGVLSTRGDGEYGNDLTHLVDLGVVFVPPSIQDEEFRGELVISRPYFNEHLSQKATQPRSFVNSFVNTKNFKGDKLKALQDGAVRAVSFAGIPEDASRTYQLTPENIDLIVATIEEIHADLINSVPYDCDGIAMTVLEPEIKQLLGRKGNNWQYMLAYKLRGERKTTPITGISWSMSRYGVLTPVIAFKPVTFDQVTYEDGTTTKGLTMKRASGFNLSLCQRKGYGIGAEIVVLLSGEVIPYIDQVVKPSMDIDYPKECPYCETPTKMRGPYLVCPNKKCRGALSKRILLFTQELDIKGFGEKRLLKLVDNGIDKISKVLAMDLNEYRKMFGKRYGTSMYRNIQRAFHKGIPKATLIRALGIEKIGEGKADALVQVIPDLNVRRLNEMKRQEILSIKGIGPKTADVVQQSLKQMWPQIESIMTHDFLVIEPQRPTPLRQNPESFMFAGEMDFGMKQIQRFTRQSGNKVATSFDDKVDYLIVGKNPGQYRLKMAKKKKIPIIKQKEFFAKVKK